MAAAMQVTKYNWTTHIFVEFYQKYISKMIQIIMYKDTKKPVVSQAGKDGGPCEIFSVLRVTNGIQKNCTAKMWKLTIRHTTLEHLVIEIPLLVFIGS